RARGLRRLPAARLRRSLRGRATRTHAALAGVHRWAIPEQAAAENRRFVLGNNPPVPTGSDPRAAVRDSGHRAVAVDARRAASRRPARDLVRSLERTTRDRWREADGGSRAIRRRLAATDWAEAHAPPPIKLADLSGIDAVLISHDHYDHLDMATIQHLAQQGTQFYVGLGVGAHLERWKVPPAQIHEMDWWESVDLKSVQINCTPARHYSGRKRQDNSTLWASWVVKGAQHSFYFSGDTGYADHFRAIHARYGDTDLNLIKIGAYGTPPSWLDIHMDPESAVRANHDLGGGILLPVHGATFNLSYHAWDEPILRAVRAAADQHVQLVTPRVGEVLAIGQPFNNVEWYQPAR